MKTNCWLILGTMIATSAVAQVDTNTLPAIPAPAPAAPAPAVAPVTVTETASAPDVAPVKKKAPAKKKAVKKIYEPTITLVPGPATVLSENLNMRGQAGLKGEAIGKLKRGETVTVISQMNLDKHALDEPAQWVKIALPAGSKVWVSSHFVDTTSKTVTAKKLNLRAGPGENYSVLGVLEKGASFTEVSTKGSWIEIEAPASACAYVAAIFLKQEAPVTAPVEPVTPTPVAVTPEPVPTPVAPSEPIAPTPAAPVPVVNNGTPSAPVVEIAPPPSGLLDTNPPAPRIVSHQGMVRRSTSPVAPTYFEIYDPGTSTTINYIYTSAASLDLSRYEGAEVIVTGEEGLTDRWPDTPVIHIQKIYVVNMTPVEPSKRLSTPRASGQNISGSKPKQSRR